jgi:hypothetical protein
VPVAGLLPFGLISFIRPKYVWLVYSTPSMVAKGIAAENRKNKNCCNKEAGEE